ncbi:zinc finger protein 253-like [Belonocnema kinseyi]|uniref:zinc finger protein 253-like n=1 Tax=Belonocnema kinseyi TaxID=2817044 RepID=UPI00143D2109|nr:zinc finger protein 253-like [Belonocnema kinseyi]
MAFGTPRPRETMLCEVVSFTLRRLIFVADHKKSKSQPKKRTKRRGCGTYSSTKTDISSDNNSDAKNLACLIKYEVEETLDIKQENVEDPEPNEVKGRKRNKQYEFKFCAVDVKEDHMLAVNKEFWSPKKNKIQDLLPEKKYKCEKCARCYSKKGHLTRHKKFECDVKPQFTCKFCGKSFRHKRNIIRHVDVLHNRKNVQTTRKSYNCDECSRSYNWPSDLCRHKRVEHSAIKGILKVLLRNQQEDQMLGHILGQLLIYLVTIIIMPRILLA